MSIIEQLRNCFSGVSSDALLAEPYQAWKAQLSDVALSAEAALTSLKNPDTPNLIAARYIVMDLLDTLAVKGIVAESPFTEYSERVGSFDDQFGMSWKNLSKTIFVDNRDAQRGVYTWGKLVHKNRTMLPREGSLHWGIRIWEAHPPVIIGADPVGSEMALSRLMAHICDEDTAFAVKNPIMRREFAEVVREFSTVTMSPIDATNVLWRRTQYGGLSHLACLATLPEIDQYPDLVASRFIWMHTCLYYTLIRGKFFVATHTGVADKQNVNPNVRQLETDLTNLISLLVSEVFK